MTKEEEENSSWRDTLFIWDGILVADEQTKNEDDAAATPVKWEGTWVGVENKQAAKVEAPKRGAFDELVSSENHFHISGFASEEKDGSIKASCVEGSGWDMGEGEDKKKHVDTRHDLYMESLKWTGAVGGDQSANLIFAEGENEFGKFVGVGWVRPGNRLTVARRYLGEKDERTLNTVRKIVWEEVCSGEKTRIPPWQCSVMDSEWNSKKRSRDEQEGGQDEDDKKTKES